MIKIEKDSAAGSVASLRSAATTRGAPSGKKPSPGERATKKAGEWVEDMSVTAALEGEKQGVNLYGARETMKALTRHRGTCSEGVILQSHIDLVALAEDAVQLYYYNHQTLAESIFSEEPQ